MNFFNIFGVLAVTSDGEKFKISKFHIILNVLKILVFLIGKDFINHYSMHSTSFTQIYFKNFKISTQTERKFWGTIVIIAYQVFTSGIHVKLINQNSGGEFKMKR
jgi:hypothetical protein